MKKSKKYDENLVKYALLPKFKGIFSELFVCGITVMSSQLIRDLSTLSQGYTFPLVLCHRGSDRIYEVRCLFL